jgi:hypothetical protein
VCTGAKPLLSPEYWGIWGGCNVFYSDVRIKSKKKGKEKERKEKEEMTSRVRERGYFRVKEFLE